jgi:hypothetical protein
MEGSKMIEHIIKILFAACIISSFIEVSEAALAENSLDVNLIKYDPYPVNPGSDFNIWVRVKNVGDNDVNGASIEFVPKYPFTIKIGESAVKYPGTIRKNDEIVYRYAIHVDNNAPVGTNSIEIGYRINGIFTKKESDIEVGSDVVNTRGTVRLEKYTIQPDVLMAGDVATVILTLKNSASQYSIELDGKDYSMNAQIQSAELLGNELVEVTSEPYYNVGIIGPGDSVELSYTIKAKDDTQDGTYFLDFDLKGSARLYSLSLKIPIIVDSSEIEAVLSEAPQSNSNKIILSVANKRPNVIKAVTVVPVANATFEPAEYFIGTMEPDELFTVKFDFKSNNLLDSAWFNLDFKNGNNWHESKGLFVNFNSSKSKLNNAKKGNPSLLPVFVIVVTVLILITGFFVLMRRRRAKSDTI